MKTTEIERNILVDKPSREDRFHGKGHERTAFALSKAIAEFDQEDRAIGLDGPWGSGKSSVVEIAEDILRKQQNQDSKPRIYHFFTFDIWKSQGSAFRRSFLEHLLHWAREEFKSKDKKLDKIEKSVKGKTTEVETNNRPKLDFHGVVVLVLLPFLPVFYFWTKSVFDDVAQEKIEGPFVGTLPFTILIGFVIFTFLWAVIRWQRGRKITEDYSYWDALSQTLLVSSKQHSDHKVTQQIREIDPNDYEFRETLREILATVQTGNHRVVFVLDNIDRLPTSEIPDYWALVRSIFSRGNGKPHQGRETITAIVPYDHHLVQQKDDDAGLQKGSGGELEILSLSLGSRELFSKTFDEVLTVSPPVMSNVREFFVEKMKEALPKQCDEDVLFRVYRIFTVLIQSANGVATPRQIISFINDLSGEFTLHQGRFSLPTIAAFVTFRSRLEANPQMLTEGKIVDSKIASLAADPDLDRNMAALTFNVEPELAFQILLDDKIKTAATDDNEKALVDLSSAPGFEDRVADVVQDSVREWVGTDEYGQAVANFSELAKVYKGQAKQHFCAAIVSAFNQLPAFNLSAKNYEREVLILDICEKEDIDQILLNIMTKINLGLKDNESADAEYGGKLAGFLTVLQEKLEPLDMGVAFTKRLANLRIPNRPDFVFGLAGSLNESNIELLKLNPSKIAFTEDNDSYLEEAATKDPRFAVKAFSEFNSVKLLKPEKWVEIANSLVEVLAMEAEFDDDYASLLKLLCDVWFYADAKQRKDVQLGNLFESGRFYQNIFKELNELKADEVGYVLFLAAQDYLDGDLPQPMKRNPNGHMVADSSDAYKAFKALFDGEQNISAKQANITAITARDTSKMFNWVKLGADESSLRKNLADKVVRTAFKLNPLPWLTLPSILNNYNYLKSVLNSDEFSGFLSRFANRVTDESVKKITLSQVSPKVLQDTETLTSSGWGKLHQHVDQLLQAIETAEWETHIKESDGISDLLCQRVEASNFIMESPDFKELLVKTAIGLLRGDPEFENVDLNGDDLFLAIEEKHHGDVLRRLRDEINNVTAVSLVHAVDVFPALLSKLVVTDDRVSKKQKDNLVRSLLCPALENDNAEVLNIFFGLGRAKVADFIKSAESTTKDRVEASCKDFAKKSGDKDRIKQVSELIHGRRAKTFMEKWMTLDF
nr:P-loop NTPase fold protein [uncultured Cohaesibacter sp.]